MTTPRSILQTLLPHLKAAARYANFIQSKISSLPSKEAGDNFFAAALTDADISIQTAIEVALLGNFPDIRFYGEEYEQSCNTKYFKGIDLGKKGDYLVTLDPIDGTKFYVDGHSNYQIILGILNDDDFEAVIAISPAQNTYYYAIKNEGAYQGSLDKDLEECTSFKIVNPKPVILLGWEMGQYKPALIDRYEIVDIQNDYSSEVAKPNHCAIFAGQTIAGSILRRGKFIDGGALAFLAREAGCIVTCLDGSPLPLLSDCEDYCLPGLLVASSEKIHQDLLEVVKS